MSMLKPILRGIIVFSFAIGFAPPCLAISGVPDLFESEAFIAFPGPGEASLMVVPDGSGPLFTGAHDQAGNIADATITLYLRDLWRLPIVNFPLEDIWLESADGGLVPCRGGTTPDDDTDINGMTFWNYPPFAGRYSEAPVLVLVNGSPLTSNNGLPLKFNSPDINGDGSVNLTDVAYLSVDYFAGYFFRSDFNGDGTLNLSDIALLARHYGAQCP